MKCPECDCLIILDEETIINFENIIACHNCGREFIVDDDFEVIDFGDSDYDIDPDMGDK